MYRLHFQSGRNKGKRLLVRQTLAAVGSSQACTVRLRDKDCPWPQAFRLEKRAGGVVPVPMDAGDALLVNGHAPEPDRPLEHGDVLSAGPLEIRYQEIIPPNAPRLRPGGGVAQTLATLAILCIMGTELALLAFTANWPKYIIEENIEKIDIAYAERQRQLQDESAAQSDKEGKPDASSIIVMPGWAKDDPKAGTAGTPSAAPATAPDATAAPQSPEAASNATETAAAPSPATNTPAVLPDTLREALEDADFAPAEIGDVLADLPEVAAFDPIRENIESLLTEAKAAAQFSDYPRAFMLLNQIHQMAPGNLPAHMYHARLLESRGDLDAAYQRWRQLLGLAEKGSAERAEIIQAGRRLQQRLRLRKTVSGYAGVDPETLPHRVRIADPEMQKMPSDSEIAEMRILRGRIEAGNATADAADAAEPPSPFGEDTALQLYVTFYDQEPGGRIVPTRALVSPSPLHLAPSGANASGPIPFEATYIVPAVRREGTQEPVPHASIYHGYTLHLFSGGVLQDAWARPARLLELPIHVAAPADGD